MRRAALLALLLLLFGNTVVDGGKEAFAGESAVLELGASVLNGDGDAGGDVAESHLGRRLVDVLAAGTGGALEDFFEFSFVQRGDPFHF